MREIRRGRPSDLPALAEIFWRGVHEGAAPRYSVCEREAWLPRRPDPQAWAARLAGQDIFVTESSEVITGFMTLTPESYLDFAYVLPEARRTGTADALLAMLLNMAHASDRARLTTRASDMAQPFFARHGWRAVAAAPQLRDGVTVSATEMAFDLRGPVA